MLFKKNALIKNIFIYYIFYIIYINYISIVLKNIIKLAI